MTGQVRRTFESLLAGLRDNHVTVLGVAAVLLLLSGLLVLPMLGSDPEEGAVEIVDAEGSGDRDEPAEERSAAGDARDDPAAAEAEESSSEPVQDGAAGPDGPGQADVRAPTSPAEGTQTAAPQAPDDPGPESGPAPAPQAQDVGNSRGVSDDTILIGVAVPDIGAFTAVNPEWDIGDMREQMEAILDGWRRSGAVPVHGRDIRFVYREYGILSSEEKIAACRGFVQDDGVFAVIAGQSFGDGAECVTDRFETPLISVNSAFAVQYERSAPFYFTVRTQFELLLRNWMAWADTSGLLEGKVIGLYYEDDWDDAVEVGVRQELERRGYEIEEEVAITSTGQMGASQAPVAVRRLQAADVDLVIPVVRAVAFLSFTTQAESQMYRPDYILTDTSPMTTDAGLGPNPDNQVDGIYAMTQLRVGEIAAGMTVTREAQDCVANYERYSGKDIGFRSPETAEYDNLLQSCDLTSIMLRGLHVAGPALGHLSLVGAWQQIDDMGMAGHGNISFVDRMFGARAQRTIQWSAGCRCWTAVSAFSPFHY